MTYDSTTATNASLAAQLSLAVPRGIMTFASDGRGSPTREQRALYLGAITFAYASWENYVEEVAQELVSVLSANIEASRIPSAARSIIDEGASAWELAVHPGWRGLWMNRVETLAVGDGGRQWGLNTANADNTRALFTAAGLDQALPERIPAPLDSRGRSLANPSVVAIRTRDSTLDVRNALTQLVTIRGEAVHTAKTTSTLLKKEVIWWSAFVERLIADTDELARKAVDSLLQPASSPTASAGI